MSSDAVPDPLPKENLGSAHFEKVAAARGSKWAEANMAALVKKEKLQSTQIVQLRQDLERALKTADTAQRELAELKQQMREQTHEAAPALPRLASRQSDRPKSRWDSLPSLAESEQLAVVPRPSRSREKQQQQQAASSSPTPSSRRSTRAAARPTVQTAAVESRALADSRGEAGRGRAARALRRRGRGRCSSKGPTSGGRARARQV